MSFERSIASQGLKTDPGARPDPAPVTQGGSVSAKGGQVNKDKRGHQRLGQSIHHQMELMTRSLTSQYQTTGEIDPGKIGAYVIRAAGDLSISLAKPPAVPSEQVHPQGQPRTRTWQVTVSIFHASSANVTWPSGVIWGRTGYHLSGDPTTLNADYGPPENPRASGTSDRFLLEYDERTGEWFAHATHLERLTADPLAQDPDATEPEPEIPNDPDNWGDDGWSDQPPANEYRDPDTGEIILPEPPTASAGELLAIHSEHLSYSADCGATWRVGPTPAGIQTISAMRDYGVAAACADGSLWCTTDMHNWFEYSIEQEVTTPIEVVLENGDFEFGDLTNWDVLTGARPLVVAGTQPPMPGAGQFYLTGSDDFQVPTAYEISREITVPVSSSEVQLHVDVWCGADATAELTLEAIAAEGGFDMELGVLPEWSDNYNLRSDPMSQLTIIGDASKLTQIDYVRSRFRYIQSSSSFQEYVQLRFGGWSGGVSTPVPSQFPTDANIAWLYAQFITKSYSRPRAKKEFSIDLTNPSYPGEVITVVIPEGWAFPHGSSADDPTDRSEWVGTDITAGTKNPFPIGVATTSRSIVEQAFTGSTGGKWSSLSVPVPVGASETLRATLGTSGNAASVYFDNVRMTYTRHSDRQEQAKAVCRDLGANRRHVVATAYGVYSLKVTTGSDNLVPLGKPTIAAEQMAAHGDTILLAAGSTLSVSTNNAASFTDHALGSTIRKVWAHPRVIAQLASGEVFEIVDGAPVSLGVTPDAGELGHSSKWGGWFAVTRPGVMHFSKDLVSWSLVKQQPVDQTVYVNPQDEPQRHLLATEIGRLIGWSGADMFYADGPTQSWGVGGALTSPIQQLIEVK